MQSMAGEYNQLLVLVSVVVVILSSFVALSTVPRINSSSTYEKNGLWVAAFGLSMGTGIWSMHFIGMLAFQMPMPVHYDIGLTSFSLLLAIVVSAISILPLRSGGRINFKKALGIGTMMGGGVAGMHYTGMAAMKMNATMQYDLRIVLLSVVIAIIASTAALLIANHLRDTKIFSQLKHKTLAAFVMGMAVSSMHYTAMVGMTFYPTEATHVFAAVVEPYILVVFVIIVTFLIEGGTIITALLDEAYSAAKSSELLMRRRADANQALADILETALENRSLKDVLTKVLSIILNIEWLALNGKGSIFLVDNKSPVLHLAASHNFTPSLLEMCAEVKFGQCLCGRAAETNQIVFKNCIDQEHEIQPDNMEPHGHYCIPFSSRGDLLGVINLYVKHDHKQAQDELEFLHAVADAVANIVHQSSFENQANKIFKAIDQAGEAVVITDKEGLIEYVNQAFTTITGFTESDAIGKTPAILNSGNQDKSFYSKMWETILKGNVWQGEVVEKRKDGTFYPAMLTISPIRNEANEIMNFVGIHEDLSEHKSLQDQFRQSQKMEALGTLVGGIAHDFNNMLAGMIGNIYLVKRKTTEIPEVQEKLGRVEQVGYQAAEMIKQMLVFARNDEVVMRQVSLSSFIKEAFKLHQVAIPENIKVTMSISDEALQIEASPSSLQQVILNLFGNAVDAVTDVRDPNVMLRLEKINADADFCIINPDARLGDYACLEISDNGHGIKPEHLNLIFDPFFTTKEVGKGTGLGLAMSATIIKAHQGFITVDSKQGEGTAFKIYLPLVDAKSGQDIDGISEVNAKNRGESVLIVDDDEGVRTTTSEMLRSMGYKTFIAVNGRDAVAHYSTINIDLVILDIVMPEMGGAEAAREILALNPEANIIFATGYDRDSSIQKDEGLKMIPVLAKPFKVSDLTSTIRMLLD